MVKRHQQLMVRVEGLGKSRKELWTPNRPLPLLFPEGWSLRSSENKYILSPKRRGSSKVVPIVFTEQQAKSGVSFKLGKAKEMRLQIWPTSTSAKRWISNSNFSASDSNLGVMVLSGEGEQIHSSELCNQAFRGVHQDKSLFYFRIVEGKLQLQFESDEVHALHRGRKLSAQEISRLLPSQWEEISVVFQNHWWKLKWIHQTSEASFFAETLMTRAAKAVGAAALLLMVFAVPILEHATQSNHGASYTVGLNGNEKGPEGTVTIKTFSKPVQQTLVPPTVAAQAVIPAPEVAVIAQPTKAKVGVASKTPQKVRAGNTTTIDRAAAKALAQAEWLKNQMRSFDAKGSLQGAVARKGRNNSPTLAYGMLQIPSALLSDSKPGIREAASALPGGGQQAKVPTEDDDIKKTLKAANDNVILDKESGSYSVIGGLTAAQVEEAVANHWSQVRSCYETALGRKSGIQGKMLLSFIIGKTGKVDGIRIAESTIADNKLENCLVHQVRNWIFPTPTSEDHVSVSYPFVFKPVGVD